MILDQIITESLEQLPESRVHTLAFRLLKERERAARAEADRDKYRMEALIFKSRLNRMPRVSR